MHVSEKHLTFDVTGLPCLLSSYTFVPKLGPRQIPTPSKG